jgi:hypothetical protein
VTWPSHIYNVVDFLYKRQLHLTRRLGEVVRQAWVWEKESSLGVGMLDFACFHRNSKFWLRDCIESQKGSARDEFRVNHSNC